MRINRVVIRNLKALRKRDDSFELGLSAGPSTAVCLRGINGSGKTTYLWAIASLWEEFRRWCKSGGAPSPTPHLQDTGTQVSLLFSGLPGPESSVGLHLGADSQFRVLEFFHPQPTSFSSASEVRKLTSYWNRRIQALQLAGVAESPPEPLPNLVYLGAEDRTIAAMTADSDLSEPAAEDAFRWLARYTPSGEKGQHIENSITALRLVSPSRFGEIRERLHSVLSGVELLDQADPKTLRPQIRVKGDVVTTLDGLSAGERAAFIALFHVARWMTPGGIVLIDEPELHQHISLMRTNLAALESFVVKKMGGQLIVASHAPDVWEHFRHTRVMIDLDEPSVPVAPPAKDQK